MVLADGVVKILGANAHIFLEYSPLHEQMFVRDIIMLMEVE